MKIPFEEKIILKQYVDKQVELYRKEFNVDPQYVAYTINAIDSVDDLNFIKNLYKFYIKESYDHIDNTTLENILAKVIDKSIYDFIINWFKDALIIVFDYKTYKETEQIKILGLANICYNTHYYEEFENEVYDYIRHCVIAKEIITSNNLDNCMKTIRVFQLASRLIDINRPDLIINLKADYLNPELVAQYNPIRIECGLMLNNLTSLSRKIHNEHNGYDMEYKNFHIIPFRPENAFSCSDETVEFIKRAEDNSQGIIFIKKPDFLQYNLSSSLRKRQEICYNALTRNHQIYVAYNDFELDEAIGLVEFAIANKHHIYLNNLYMKEGYNSEINYRWLLYTLIRDLSNRFDAGTMLHYRLYDTKQINFLLHNNFVPISYTVKFTKQDDKISLFSKLFN